MSEQLYSVLYVDRHWSRTLDHYRTYDEALRAAAQLAAEDADDDIALERKIHKLNTRGEYLEAIELWRNQFAGDATIEVIPGVLASSS